MLTKKDLREFAFDLFCALSCGCVLGIGISIGLGNYLVALGLVGPMLASAVGIWAFWK